MEEKQVLPKNINLADRKPEAVESYVRRYRNIAQGNSDAFTEDQEIIIPIDTATASCFLDCSMSYLQFDLTIDNQNPYIDYIDFGVAGALSCFNQLQVRVNGASVETIYDFNTVNEIIMTGEGLSQQAFELYQSRLDSMSRFEAMSANDYNTAKPPMVDLMGRIMGATYAAIPNPTYGQTYTAPNTSACQGQTSSANQANGPWRGLYNTVTGAWNSNSMTNLIVKPGLLATGSGTGNINFWPQILGVDENCLDMLSKAPLRSQDYLAYLSNVRNIPVGCTTKFVPNNGAWTTQFANTVPTANFHNGSFVATVCMPLLCGTLGILNPKMFPTMLTDNLQLVLTVAKSSQALKVSMDPCRRIPGTHRDFLTYYGNQLGNYLGTTAASANANVALPNALNTDFTGNNVYGTSTTVLPVALTGVASGTAVTAYGDYLTTYFPAGGVVPQYIQTSLCAGDGNLQCVYYGTSLVNIGNDANGCYGTKLKASTAQTKRCIINGIYGNAGSFSYQKENQGIQNAMPKISIRNIVYVAQQVIVPERVTSDIIASALGSDISVQSATLQVYRTISVARSSSQNIIIPAKVNNANSMICIFRANTQTNTANTRQYLVNSLTGVCPFGAAIFTNDTTSFVGTNQQPGIEYVRASGTTGFSAQLNIGADLVPMQPMTTIAEMVTEFEKCQHGIHTRYNNITMMNPILMTPVSAMGGAPSTSGPVYDIFKDGGYCTTWVDPDYLDDQTIVNNALWPLLCSTAGVVLGGGTPSVPVPVGSYKVPLFKHPSSKFVLAFDLDTWAAFTDMSLSGRYLGNNTTSLRLEGCKLFEASPETFTMTAIVPCEMRISWQAGGSVQTFT